MKRLITLCLIAIFPLSAMERDRNDKSPRSKILINGEFLEANNVKAMMSNNGWLFWGGGPSGFIVPTPTFSNNDGNFATVYASGIWLAGKVNGVVKTSIAYYGSDYGPGSWDAYTANPTGLGSPSNSVWKIYYYYAESHLAYLNNLKNSPDPTESQKIHAFADEELARAATANTEWATAAVAQGAPEKPPGHLAAFTIYHDANLTTRNNSGDADPLNVQIRQLAWSFRQGGPLNNTVFIKFEFINKNAVPITDMYASLWADPDLGQFQDDFVGSDKALGLGYCYNGQADDAQYTAVLGVAPPAVGYDYFQGPIVDNPGTDIVQRGVDFFVYLNLDDDYTPQPSDVIIPDKYIRPATSFYYYNNGDEPSTAVGWQNFMKGLTESGTQNQRQLDALAANLTTPEDAPFFFNGDPEAGSGWLDSDPSDRRFILNNGPFELGVSDGTEAFGDPGYNSSVAGVFVSFGATATNSVTQLKLDDQVVQGAYIDAFKVIPLPPALNVTVNADDQQLNFTWTDGSIIFDDDGVKRPITALTYKENGYSIFAVQIGQFQNAALAGSENFKEVAMLDLVDGIKLVKDDISFVEEIVWRGNDTGIRNDFSVTTDLFSSESNPLLLNYTPYHFGVRVIAYNPNPIPGQSHIRKGEWAVGLTNLVPKKQDIGTTVQATVNELLTAESVATSTDGVVTARVVNPYALTNAKYKISFSILAADKEHIGYPGGTIPAGTIVWNMIRVDGAVENQVLTEVPQAPNPAEGFAYTRVVDGIAFTVSGPEDDFKNFLVTANAAGPLDPPEPGALGFAGFPHPGVADRPGDLQQSTNSGKWAIHTGTAGDGSRGSYASYLSRSVTGRGGWGHLVPHDFEIRFTAGPNYGWENFGNGQLNQIPFEVWNTSLGFRCVVAHLDDANGLGAPYADHIFNYSGEDHEASSSDNDPQTDWFYFYEPNDLSAGDAGYQAWLASGNYGSHGSEIIGRQVFVNFNGGSVSAVNFPANTNSLMPEQGTVFQMITNKPNSATAAFEVTSPGAADFFNTAKAESNFDAVNVWPNPYRGWHELQLNTGGFMEFINLPRLDANGYVNIKIYNLSGDLVKNLRYTGGSGTLRWFLDNDSNLKVATGIYIAYIKYRSTSKVIKMAVNVGENRPKTF